MNLLKTVFRENDTLLIKFTGPRVVAGNSTLNGGVKEGVYAVFNHTIPEVRTAEELPGGRVDNYLEMVAKELGLDPAASSGLITAARMDNAAVGITGYRQLEVRAVITAGVDINGGRAGDPASYYEEGGQFHCPAGTINIILEINASLPPGALLKCVITATEAKTAALQELQAPSRYSAGLATGSGTDGIMVVTDPAAALTLTDAGLHSKLGELIGRTVKKGVKEALARETGLSPERQMSALERLKRFGIDQDYCRERAVNTHLRCSREEYNRKLASVIKRPEMVALTAALAHLQDEVTWGLLPQEQAYKAAVAMAGGMDRDVLQGKGIKPDDINPIIKLLVEVINQQVLKERTQNSGLRTQDSEGSF